MRTWLACVALTLVPLPLTAAAPEADTVSPNPLLQEEWTTPTAASEQPPGLLPYPFG